MMVKCDVMDNLVALAGLGFLRLGLGDPELYRSQIPPRTERREVTLAGKGKLRLRAMETELAVSPRLSSSVGPSFLMANKHIRYLLELPSSPGGIRNQPL